MLIGPNISIKHSGIWINKFKNIFKAEKLNTNKLSIIEIKYAVNLFVFGFCLESLSISKIVFVLFFE